MTYIIKILIVILVNMNDIKKQKIYTTKEVSELLDDPEQRQKIYNVAVFKKLKNSLLDPNLIYMTNKKNTRNRKNSSTSNLTLTIEKSVSNTNASKNLSKRNSNTTLNVLQNVTQGSLHQNLIEQQSPKLKKELNKLSIEFEEYKQRQIQKDIRLTLIEENYFPFEKYPPINHLNPNPNYIVLFIFRIELLEFLFIKRFDPQYNINYFWAKKEDVDKYGIDYNDMRIPGLFFDTMENFTSYSKIKNSSNKLQTKINEQLKIINGFNGKNEILINENNNLKNSIEKYLQKELQYENIIKEYAFENDKLKEDIELMDNKIKELTEKNKQLKDSVEDITKKYDNNRVFYELNKKVNQLPKIIEDSLGKITIRQFCNLTTEASILFSIIGESSNGKEKVNQEIINNINEKFNDKLKTILFKVKKDFDEKEEEYNEKIVQIQNERDEIVINLENELHTVKLENQNNKRLVKDLKYLIEIKECEANKITNYENEIQNLKNQIRELKNYNEHYNNLINEKESLFEENESKLKGLIIKLKEKDNQIADYANTINHLQHILLIKNTEKDINQSPRFEEILTEEQYINHSDLIDD